MLFGGCCPGGVVLTGQWCGGGVLSKGGHVVQGVGVVQYSGGGVLSITGSDIITPPL